MPGVNGAATRTPAGASLRATSLEPGIWTQRNTQPTASQASRARAHNPGRHRVPGNPVMGRRDAFRYASRPDDAATRPLRTGQLEDSAIDRRHIIAWARQIQQRFRHNYDRPKTSPPVLTCLGLRPTGGRGGGGPTWPRFESANGRLQGRIRQGQKWIRFGPKMFPNKLIAEQKSAEPRPRICA